MPVFIVDIWLSLFSHELSKTGKRARFAFVTDIGHNMEDLPPEILVLILANLPLTTLLNGLSLVSKKFYFLIKHEIQSGRLAFDLEIGPRFCHLPLLRLNSLKLTGFGDKIQIFQVLDQVNPDIQLYFENCPAVKSKKFCWVETTYVCFLPQSNQTL